MKRGFLRMIVRFWISPRIGFDVAYYWMYGIGNGLCTFAAGLHTSLLVLRVCGVWSIRGATSYFGFMGFYWHLGRMEWDGMGRNGDIYNIPQTHFDRGLQR